MKVFKDQERIDRWMRFYVHHRALYTKGWMEMQFIKRLLSPGILMLGWLFLKDLFPNLPYWVLGIIVPVVFLSQLTLGWYIGYWWNKNEVFQKEADWRTKRHPALKGVTDELLKNVDIKGY